MVGMIVRLHLALTTNRMTGGKAAQLILGASLGFVLATATIVLGFVELPSASRADLVAVVLGLWLLGWLVAPSFTGGPELTGQYFRLHPISRGTLTRGLFVAAWTGLPVMVALVAFAVLIALAAPLGPAAVLVAVPSTILSVSMLVLAGRLAAIWFAAVSGSRLGSVISSVVTAAIIVVAQHSWLLVVAIMVHLDTGLPGALGAALRALPSSWGLVAVMAAGNGEWTTVAGALCGLGLLCVLLYLLWMRVVTTAPVRSATVRAPARHRPVHPSATRKELLGWFRDPLRLQDVALALAYAVGTCALPLILDFGGLLPFLGVAAVLLGTATSSNLYGTDGTALWMTLAVPGSERQDVRGRQLAWLLVFGGLGAVLTVLGLLLHPDPALVPWALGAFLASLGAGAGLVVVMSVYALAPSRDRRQAKHSPADQSDETGPAFATLFLSLVLMLPTLGMLLGGQLSGRQWLLWGGVGAAALTAVLSPLLLGAAAAHRLATHGPELLHRMRSGPTLPRQPGADVSSRPGQTSSGTLGAGFEAMRGHEALAFWALYVMAILAIIPQGVVAGAHLLAGSDVTSWFLALHLPPGQQWLAVVGFLALGTALVWTATLIYTRARSRIRSGESG